MFRRVAIVGGGAAAASVISELLDRPSVQPLQLDWFAGTPPLARGVAYGTPSERHLLNVRAASMSMFTGKPRGFLEFAQRGDSNIAGIDFLPRRLYGDYLEAEVARALAQADQAGHRVTVHPVMLDTMVPDAEGVTLVQGDERLRVDAAVLAIGSLPPQPLPGVDPEAIAQGRYVIDPWAFMADLPDALAPRDVLLVGMGLTAADVLLELGARWPETRFTAISRHGHLPEEHHTQPTAPMDDGGELVETMYDAPDMRSWVRAVRETIESSNDWRTVVDSLRPHLPKLWQQLPADERARYLRHVRWSWERVRHRMPPQTATAMQTLEDQGRLLRRAGRLHSVKMDAADLTLKITPHGTDAPEIVHADLVIQTVGLNTDVRRTQHALMRQLSDAGHVVPDPLGLGCVAEPDLRLHHVNGIWPHVFAIGSMLRGTLWETTAIPEIRQQARSLAERLLA